MLFRRDSYFVVPGYLLETVFNPTGAGDCFAGGSSATWPNAASI